MDRKWNVDLFKNREECLEALKAIDDGIDKLKSKNPSAASADASLELIQEYFKYRDLAYRCLVYGSLSFYADTSEENAELKRLVEQKNEDTISSLSFINEMFISMGKDEIERQLDENADLRKYRHYLDELFRKQRHEKSSEEIVSLKKSINNLIQEYNRIVLGVKFDSILVDEKEIELDNKNIAKYLTSRDHETREQAYLSLNHGYQKVEDELVGLIDELYEKRNALSKLLGYRNVLEMALDEEAIEPTILEKTIDIVHKKIELLQKYMKEKKRILGYPEPHLYDLGISLESGIKKKFPFEETIPLLDKIFEPLGEKYTAVIHRLFGENHIDSEIRDSKHQITFSWYGFSFLNYHDAYGDLKNLVHELGHSSNDLLSQHLPFPYRISSVFVGETASIVNEILLVRYLLSQSEKEDDKRYYLEKEIDNYITSVYRQILYTEYELELYQKVESGEHLTREFLESTYEKLIKTYYGDGIIYDPEISLEWMRLGHQIRWTFYSYRYATGLLIAATVYAKIVSGELPQERYLEFLASGSKENSLDLLKILDIDFSKDDILENGFKVLEEDLTLVSEYVPTPLAEDKKEMRI